MSTIIDRVNSINQGVQSVKADFKTALENKGVGVADTLKLKDYPPLIEDIQSGGGRGIGEIFAYPSALPPEGAYLLNGQTITNCQTLYPDFWNWLTSQIGEYETVPIYKSWTQTPLTKDGTIGGSAYAVEPSGTIASNNYHAWRSFDMTAGGSNSVCAINTATAYLTYYSPVDLRINTVRFVRATTSMTKNRISSYIISGSNDNSTWTELASGDWTDTANSATLDISIDSSKYSTNKFYRYYKFYATSGGTNITEFPEIYLYGEEFVRTIQESNGYIRAINAEGYEAEIAEYGMCDAFVISGSDVRLPTWKGYQTPLGNSVPVIGNGMAMGFTNGTSNFGSTETKDYRQLCLSLNDYGGNVGDTGSYSNGTTNVVVGVTEDGTKSGIIVDTSGLYPDRWSWVIQVFNTATDLSNQESAELASQMQMKAQKDLANIEETLSDNFFDKIMPDYTAGVSVGTSFEAVTYGLVYYLLTTTIDGEATVNGVVVSEKFIKNENDYASLSQTFYVSKGDIVIIPTSGIFYPLKGADK